MTYDIKSFIFGIHTGFNIAERRGFLWLKKLVVLQGTGTFQRVTGHRDIPEARIAYVEQELRREVEEAIAEGYTRFISGFAEGVDLMFAAIVVEQMEHRPELFLEAAIPYAGRLKTKNQQFQKLLRACKGVKVVCREYAPSCFLQRNRYMAGESQRVIAVYDGRERGGTLFTMRYAHSIGREVREIRV